MSAGFRPWQLSMNNVPAFLMSTSVICSKTHFTSFCLSVQAAEYGTACTEQRNLCVFSSRHQQSQLFSVVAAHLTISGMCLQERVCNGVELVLSLTQFSVNKYRHFWQLQVKGKWSVQP